MDLTRQISAIIPTLNEAAHIERLIHRLRAGGGTALRQIIVADAGSTDHTTALAEALGADVVHCGVRSRPVQMNLAAKMAEGKLLYFVHADTLPPVQYVGHIQTALSRGADFGCFRFRFDTVRSGLRFNAWCTRLPFMICRGGDQSLFMTRWLFDRLKGFDEAHVVMEDYDIIRRGRKLGRFHILPAEVLVSARKYEHNSYFRVNLANFVVFGLYYLGKQPVELKTLYMKLINHPTFGPAPCEAMSHSEQNSS